MQTTIQQQAAAITRNQARIIDLLQWDMEMYTLFLYNIGVEYLSQYMKGDQTAIDKLEGRPEFWNWFKTLWNARDEAFVMEFDGREFEMGVETLRTMYRVTHAADILVCEIAPPAVVYPDDFAIIKAALA